MAEIFEYRGIEGLVYAEVLKDNNESGEGYVTGDVKSLAGVAELGRTTENSSETHYYDNMPAIVVNSTGADTVTITTSAISLDVLADITGQVYDAEKAMFVEGNRTNKYFAIGYKTKKTNGEEVYVWRYKGQFNVPDSTHATENDGTDANGQEVVFTGIQTTHKFVSLGNKGCKAINVEVAKNKVDVSDFFEEVKTPDDLEPIEEDFTLTLNQAEGTTLTVKRNGTTLNTGDTIHNGDALVITVIGGTVTVNGESFTSGNTYTVTGDTTVASASA